MGGRGAERPGDGAPRPGRSGWVQRRVSPVRYCVLAANTATANSDSDAVVSITICGGRGNGARAGGPQLLTVSGGAAAGRRRRSGPPAAPTQHAPGETQTPGWTPWQLACRGGACRVYCVGFWGWEPARPVPPRAPPPPPRASSPLSSVCRTASGRPACLPRVLLDDRSSARACSCGVSGRRASRPWHPLESCGRRRPEGCLGFTTFGPPPPHPPQAPATGPGF